MGKQLKIGLLSLLTFFVFVACDHHGREITKQLTCQKAACDTVTVIAIHFLPAKKTYVLGHDTINIKADSLGMFYVSKVGCNICRGCSKVVIQAAEGGPALNVNFFYSDKKNDSDTLSTLGLLPFKGKLTFVKEEFYDEKRKPDTLGFIQF